MSEIYISNLKQNVEAIKSISGSLVNQIETYSWKDEVYNDFKNAGTNLNVSINKRITEADMPSYYAEAFRVLSIVKAEIVAHAENAILNADRITGI